MTDAPAVFDPKALQDRIAKTVQSTFGMLIPEAQFNAMVEKEVKAYFELETKFVLAEERRQDPNGSWQHNNYLVMYANMTPFRKQVWEALGTIVRGSIEKKLAEELFAAEINRGWGGEGTTSRLSDMLAAQLERLAPQMAASMFKNMFAEAVIAAKTDIVNDLATRIGR